MQPSQRIITRTPLHELWDDRGVVPAQWLRDVGAAEIRDLLTSGPIRWAVADVGKRPTWIPEPDCFAYWKDEVRPRLADREQLARLEDFPGGYCYTASEWRDADGRPIIVLYRHH
jgi:hypothetical protein